MKRRWSVTIGIHGLMLLGVLACMRPEKPWSLPASKEMATLAADVGPEYDTVAFLSLSQGLVHKVPRKAWDLEIHSVEGGYQVWTNAAMYAFAASMDSLSWKTLSDPSNLTTWKCDLPDTAALPVLRYEEQMNFVLDRDRGSLFYTQNSERYKKIWLRATADGLEVKAYGLSGEIVGEWMISRSSRPQFLSLDLPGQVIPVLPPWEVELIWSRYVHYFPNQPEQFRYYPVFGALVPEGHRSAVVDASELAFEAFDYTHLSQVQWKLQRDAIGYDWKRYNFDTGTYVIDFSRYYVLEVGLEQYYKIQFVDFYDESGRKGSVKIRYSAL